MKNADNDNEPETFISIGLHALLILNKLQTRARLTSIEEKQAPEIDYSGQEIEPEANHPKERKHEAARHALA